MSKILIKIARHSLIALIGLGVATLGRWLLNPVIGNLFPFYTYILAIVFVAWITDWWAALVVLLLGYPLANVLFVPLPQTSTLAVAWQTSAAAIYFFVGFTIILIVHKMQTAQRRAERNAELASQREMTVHQEVQRRLRAEEDLRFRERQFTGMVENSPDIVGRLDRDLRHLYISSSVERFTGYPPSFYLGKTGLEAGASEHFWREFSACCRAVLETGRADIYAYSFLTPQGERHFECRLIAERDDAGSNVSLLFITTDVTERKRTEEALRLSEERLRLAVDAAGAGVLEWDIESGRMSWNAQQFRLFGYEAHAFEPRYEHWRARVHPDDLPQIEAKRQQSVAERRDCQGEYRLLMPDGSVRWVRMNGRFRWKTADRPAVAFVIFFDITAAKESELALSESEREFRALFHLSSIGQAQGDIETGKILRVNRRFCEITGYSEHDLNTFQFFQLTHPDDRAETDRRWRRLISGQDPEFIVEKRYLRKDGSVIWVHVTAILVRDAQGRPLHAVAAIQDITQRKHAEEESERLNRQLAEADRRKDIFLATLAHELRNPLAPIRNALEIVKRSHGHTSLMEKSCSVMERQVTQMVRLIDDLLDLSRITQDKLQLHRKKTDLATVVHHAIESCGPAVERHGHDLTLALPQETIWLNVDPVRLAQVLCNLITNASKYSEWGSRIWVVAERERDDVLIRVKDNGIGIPADMLSSVFEMFTQINQSLERSQGGLGIGLALAKRLILMHGGSISAHSAGPGEGSEFIVRLPILIEQLKQAEIMNPTDNVRISPAKHRILVVDDNRDAAESLCMLLELSQNEVYSAHDGHEAYEAAERYQPEIVLLDIGLPKMNGHDVARRIRQQSWGKNTILVALTGWGQEEDRRLTAETGFDHHLVKPVDPAALMRLLATLLERKGST